MNTRNDTLHYSLRILSKCLWVYFSKFTPYFKIEILKPFTGIKDTYTVYQLVLVQIHNNAKHKKY